jgi:hypothetical protein
VSFASDIARFAEQTGQTMDQVTRNVRLEGVKQVIRNTPVDTGQAKGSIIAAIGSPASSPNILDRTAGEGAAISRAMAAINGPSNKVFYFTSNLPYIKYLENGSSQQAPAGMFKIAAIRLRESIREAVQNATN